jgi:hypothetical protein
MIRILQTMVSVFTIITIFVTNTVAQGVPDVMPYQGYLSDGNGRPVTETVSFTFRLYSDSDTPTPDWAETISNVSVENGTFYVYLGMQTPIMDIITSSGGSMWLGIEVNDDGEATPRQRLGSVPFAMLTKTALSLGGVDAAEFLTRDEALVLIEEHLRNSGIGRPFILGTSNTFTTGRLQYTANDGQVYYGMKGANMMCRDSYPDHINAHLCSTHEVMRAVSGKAWNPNDLANIDDIHTWTIGEATRGFNGDQIYDTLGNTCQNLLSSDGYVTDGTRLTIDLDYTGQVTGAVYRIVQDIGCRNSYQVMCCR